MPLGAAPSIELLLVKNGVPHAVVVIPDEPVASVTYAADELVTHVAKASGAKLAIVRESEPRDPSVVPIYLGDTRAARALGIEAGKLPVETFVLRTTDEAFYIAGNDVVGPRREKNAADLESDRLYNSPQHEGLGDPLNMNTSAGTLFGVYEWLEHDVGVRWLWPGELGTYVPSLPTIIARPYNRTVSPHFFQRAIRPGLTFEVKHPALGFTAKAAEAYANDEIIYLRRHRMGRGTPITYHHAFVDWWEKYGRDHPEWFQLNPDGTRGPAKPGGRFSMSVSSPGLARQVVALCGDGGFSMLMGDFLTLLQYDLPVKVVLFDNSSLGMVELEMLVAGLPAHGTSYRNPDFAAIARAAGATGIRVTEILPGLTRTNIILKRHRGDRKLEREYFERYKVALDPADIARAVMFALAQPPHMQIAQMFILPINRW